MNIPGMELNLQQNINFLSGAIIILGIYLSKTIVTS